MPLRSPKMNSFIFGFQRRTWCPKWTPASSNSFIVTVANQPSGIWFMYSPSHNSRFVQRTTNDEKAMGWWLVAGSWWLVADAFAQPTTDHQPPTTEINVSRTGSAYAPPSDRTSYAPWRGGRA